MSQKIIITVNEGKILGIKKQSEFSGAEYYSFFGVPYGQSTAEHARFKDPVKAKPWQNVLDTTTEKDGCTQFSRLLGRVCGSEDCLYNNIHIPHMPCKQDSLKPVIVNIHPGALTHGSPETWYYGSPEYVMHQDIVYVCVGYRLHILGFLNLEMDECRGNQGLKDIILSLLWLKDNISSFGGDPNNITLLGSSSGATLVRLLMLSPMTKDLFHKAVLMAGYAFNPLACFPEKNIDHGIDIAQMCGFDATKVNRPVMDINDKKKLLAYLKKIEAENINLLGAGQKINKTKVAVFPASSFLPTVDVGENALLPLPGRQLIKSSVRIPLMYGICEREAVGGFCRGFRTSTMNNFYTTYRQNSWGWGRNINDDDVKRIKEKINSFYLKGYSSIEFAPISLLIDIQTDAAQSDLYNTLLDVIATDLPASVYVYKFQFEGNACTLKEKVTMLLDEPIDGTFHATDFSYWAAIKDHWGIKNKPLSLESATMVETFTKLISTFARTGNPNYEVLEVKWMPSTIENPRYLSINDELHMVDGKLNGERMEFWENLKRQFFKDLKH